MQRSTIQSVLFCFLIAPAFGQTAEDFFNDTILHEIRVDIRASDWNALRVNYQDNTYYPADFHWIYRGQDVVVREAGVRSRGRGSRNPVKPNLRIDFNQYVSGQKLFGLNSVDLKANTQDRSMVKEKTVFKLWDRTGLPASRESYARLYVNGEYWGVYLVTEEVNAEMAERVLGEGSGDLYGWEVIDGYHFEWYPSCTRPDQVACSTDPNKWQPTPFNPQENKKTFDLTPTINMIRTFTEASDANFESAASEFINLKLWLFHNAIENFVADFDAILGDVFGLNNFYLYRYSKSNLQQLLPWDKDGSYDYAQRPLFQGADANVLMRRTLNIPARRTEYLESIYKVAVLAGGPGGWMEWENQRNYNQIRDSALADTKKQWQDNGVWKDSTNAMFEAEELKNVSFLRDRAVWVLPELQSQGLRFPSSPAIATGGVLNAATNVAGPIAPGSDATIYGTGFTSQTIAATSGPLPITLGGVSVFVNGFAAPLLFVSPGQINFQVPWELGVDAGTAPFTVMVAGSSTIKGSRAGSPVNSTFTNTISAPVSRVAPGVYIVLTGTGTPVSSAPAGPGDVLVAYLTGMGPVTIPQTTGVLAPGELSYTQETPTLTVGGQNAEVLFSGLTPGTAGVYQINFRVPSGVPSGGAPLVVRIGGQTAPTYTLATR